MLALGFGSASRIGGHRLAHAPAVVACAKKVNCTVPLLGLRSRIISIARLTPRRGQTFGDRPAHVQDSDRSFSLALLLERQRSPG